MFKVTMTYPDGTTEDDDERFETKEEAHEYGEVQCSNYSAGAEVLHLHNPGDYSADDADADVDFDVVEVDL